MPSFELLYNAAIILVPANASDVDNLEISQITSSRVNDRLRMSRFKEEIVKETGIKRSKAVFYKARSVIRRRGMK